MCAAPKPKVQPLPKPRALARAPSQVPVVIGGGSNGTGKRSTVVNPDGIIKAAPTASIGGSAVVLGG